MKISMAVILALLALLYSTGCVVYALTGHDLPEPFMFPLYPGIWVGVQVHDQIGEKLMLCYAAGIGTMTALGGVLGALFDWLAEKSTTAPRPQ